MDNTEIMTTNEVVETATEEIATSTVSKGLKIAGGAIAAAGIAYLAYRYVGKPLYHKIKEKKQRSKRPITVVEDDSEALEEIIE